MTQAKNTAAVVLAAGEGRRFGGPKAIHTVAGERLVDRAVRLCQEAGCDPVVVVLGAWVGDVPGAQVVVNSQWSEGMGSSLRAGLRAVGQMAQVERVLITLVDLPGMTVTAMTRALAASGSIVQATFDGVRGHPVILARVHWAAAIAMATGDRGARDYLAAHEMSMEYIEVGDVARGEDLDRPSTQSHAEGAGDH